MSDELHVVSVVTLLDAVHTDGVAVCRVASVTPAGDSLLFSPIFGGLVHRAKTFPLHPEWRHVLPVKIVHWVAGVTGNLVQALTSAHSLFNGILIVQYFII